MKVTYQFVTGNVVIEVADEWGEVLVEEDRLMRNRDRRETRRHKSLERLMGDLGMQFAERGGDADDVRDFEDLLTALSPEQKNLLRRMYLDGEPMASIARSEGISRPTLFERVQRAYKKIYKNL